MKTASICQPMERAVFLEQAGNLFIALTYFGSAFALPLRANITYGGSVICVTEELFSPAASAGKIQSALIVLGLAHISLCSVYKLPQAHQIITSSDDGRWDSGSACLTAAADCKAAGVMSQRDATCSRLEVTSVSITQPA